MSLRCILKDKAFVKGCTYGILDFSLMELNKFVST